MTTSRKKVLLIIIAIVTVIVAGTMRVSLFFIQDSLEKTVESDITVMAQIANHLVASSIKLLKANASSAAERLLEASNEDLPRVLRKQVESYDPFMALTIFDREGIVLAYGKASTPTELLHDKYIRMAFAGESVISTSRLDPIGQLVFHICVPMGEHVLVATIPGLYFSNMLAKFKIWDTGSVYILDSEGTVMAYEGISLVLSRSNSIEKAKTDPGFVSSAEFTRKVIQSGKVTAGRYFWFGVERLAVCIPITGSNVGWVLGVSAPLQESPAAYVKRALILTTLIFLALGVVAAVFASGFIVRPFAIIKEQNERLLELKESAQKASEAKSHFLANMSHEMRTPLNAIIGFSESMVNSRASREEAKKNLEKIHISGMILLGIVNDILDLSKVESGKFALLPVEYNLASLINDTISLTIVRKGEKNIRFHLHLDEKLPSRLLGDELRIKQICNNLLSNAFKYTNEGRVDLSVFGERDGDSVWLTIRVQDTGIGIRVKDKEKLFSDYSQLNTRSDRRVEGTGLGLSIAKKMVEMMDGELSVESEYGRGSTFTARIRQGHVTDVPIGPEVVRSLQSFHYFTQKNVWKAQRKFVPLPDAAVLIVDDNETNLDVVRSILKPYGMRVDCVLGGRQAIELVRKEQTRYDAIFMDHMMPGMDGIEAARVIREEIGTEYAETVPIVALTANAIVGSDQMFLQHGFQAFLSKPIDILRMDAVLERWVRKKERRTEETDPAGDGESAGARALPDMPSTVPPAALSGILSSGLPSVLSAVMEDSFPDSGLLRRERIDGLNLEEGLRRFGGDDDTLLAVLRSFAKNTPPLLERARLPDRENLKEYTTVVHGIKGSCYGICAPVLGKMAENLEREAKSGNLDFIEANNGAFLQAAETLLADIQALLKSVDEEERKECREEPDPSVLGRLRAACASYDMDGVDAAMAELERLTYARNAELIVWLREQVDRMNFQEILDRLPM